MDIKYIVSGSLDKTLRVWDTNGNCIVILKGHSDKVLIILFLKYF